MMLLRMKYNTITATAMATPTAPPVDSCRGETVDNNDKNTGCQSVSYQRRATHSPKASSLPKTQLLPRVGEGGWHATVGGRGALTLAGTQLFGGGA